MGAFLEGLGAIEQPCTLALLVPAIALVMAARWSALPVSIGFVVGAALVAWLRFADAWFAPPDGVGAFLLGAGLAVVGVGVWRLSDGGPSRIASGLGAVGGGITAWLWQPCVGEELGSIINRAPSDGLGTLGPTFSCVLGASVMAVAIAMVPIAFPAVVRWRDGRAVAAGGALAVLAIAMLVAVGLYDDVVAELLRRSTV